MNQIDIQNSPELRDALLLGLLCRYSNSDGDTTRAAEIAAQLKAWGIDDVNGVDNELQRLVEEYRWLGLAWDERKQMLSRMGAVRWYLKSDTYNRLLRSIPRYEVLAKLFAGVAKDLGKLHTHPRLLVDAGATTFLCLFHAECERLRSEVKTLLTNNLFVALRWQEVFKDKADAVLIGGAPNLDTGATVDHDRVEQWLNTQKRRPHVSLLSWHYVMPKADKQDVLLFSRDQREKMVKHAAMKLTESVLCIVLSRDKITERPPHGVEKYSLKDDLLRVQTKKVKEQGRDVYIVLDAEPPYSDNEQLTIDLLSSPEFKKNSVWLVTPKLNTRS